MWVCAYVYFVLITRVSKLRDLAVAKVCLHGNAISILMCQSMSWIIHHDWDQKVQNTSGKKFAWSFLRSPTRWEDVNIKVYDDCIECRNKCVPLDGITGVITVCIWFVMNCHQQNGCLHWAFHWTAAGDGHTFSVVFNQRGHSTAPKFAAPTYRQWVRHLLRCSQNRPLKNKSRLRGSRYPRSNVNVK